MQSDKVKIIHTNQRQTTYDAIQYLINKGYRNIAYCTDNSTMIIASINLEIGFRVAWKIMAWILETNGFSIMFIRLSGEQIGKALLGQEQLPDAIFTGSDEVALGLMHFMTAHQINIPNQIAIMGMIINPFLVC